MASAHSRNVTCKYITQAASSSLVPKFSYLKPLVCMVLLAGVVAAPPSWAEVDAAAPQVTAPQVTSPEAAGAKALSKSKFYQIPATTIEGEKGNLSQYEGKVVLVVNTASKCGFTLQYADLQKLHEQYKDKGLVVAGFPSNDFANQEPGSNKKIQEFCRVKFGVSFPMYERGSVRGSEKQPLFEFLTEESGEEFKGEVEWNFEKFLIDKKGNLRARFGSFSNPQSQSVVAKVEALLAE
jgi:glutathione peroxidase